MPLHPQELMRAGLLTGLDRPEIHFPPGEHELQIGVEARVDGFYQQLGLHGRLKVAKRQHDPDQLLTTALALLIAAVPAAKRRKILSRIPDQAAKAVQAEQPLPYCTEARRMMRGLQHRVGLVWRPTPTYKPKA
jgi:hypothetical protein